MSDTIANAIVCAVLAIPTAFSVLFLAMMCADEFKKGRHE